MKGFRTAVSLFPNAPLWHMDYFELKTLEILPAQKTAFVPLTTEKLN